MTDQNNGPEGLLGSMIVGSIFFLAGALIVLVSADIIHADPSSFNAPRWVVAAAGAVFMLTGAIIAIQGAFGPNREQNRLYLWLQLFWGVAFMLLFSSIFLWVGFGPGEREFTTSTSVGVVTTTSSGSEGMGRFVFGGSGLIIFLLSFLMAYANWKKIRDFDG